MHYNSDNSYLCENETKIYNFKAHDNICWYELRLKSVSKEFTNDEQGEVSLNGTVYIFQLIII